MMSDPQKGDDSVECTHCKRLTRMTGTKLCDNCREVESRMRSMKVGVIESILEEVLPGSVLMMKHD